MAGIKLSVVSLYFMQIVLKQSNGLSCLTPDGPCKCSTDEGDIDISSLDAGSGSAA